MNRQPHYLRIMVIVHGQSEYCLCRNVASNLRLKHEIIARNKGKNSIQITSIMKELSNKRFGDAGSFIRNFPDVEHEKKRLQDFRLFIIMDVDDCSKRQKDDFINKNMFKDHWLHPYITPIYNDPNLEKTMEQAGILVIKKADYIRIFPTNQGDADVGEAQKLLNTLERCSATNLEEYIAYCLEVERANRNGS